MAIDTRNLEQMLSELRAASAVAGGKPASAAQDASGADFSLALKSAIDQVSAAQQQAQQMAEGASSNAGRLFGRSMVQYVQRAQGAAGAAEIHASIAAAAAGTLAGVGPGEASCSAVGKLSFMIALTSGEAGVVVGAGA